MLSQQNRRRVFADTTPVGVLIVRIVVIFDCYGGIVREGLSLDESGISVVYGYRIYLSVEVQDSDDKLLARYCRNVGEAQLL